MASIIVDRLSSDHKVLSHFETHTADQVCKALTEERNMHFTDMCRKTDALGVLKLGVIRDLELGKIAYFSTASPDIIERLKEKNKSYLAEYAEITQSFADLQLLVNYFRLGIEYSTRNNFSEATLQAIEVHKPGSASELGSSKEEVDEQLKVLRIWERELQSLQTIMGGRLQDLSRHLVSHQTLASSQQTPSLIGYLFNRLTTTPQRVFQGAAAEDEEQKQKTARMFNKDKRETHSPEIAPEYSYTTALVSTLNSFEGKSAEEVFTILKEAFDNEFHTMCQEFDNLGALDNRLLRLNTLWQIGHYEQISSQDTTMLNEVLSAMDEVFTRVDLAFTKAKILQKKIEEGIDFLTVDSLSAEARESLQRMKPKERIELEAAELKTVEYLEKLKQFSAALVVLTLQANERIESRYKPYKEKFQAYLQVSERKADAE